ncbi:PhoH family protein [Massilia sp. H-1]|nr:PhoH family protein [Massilia sp. H-1]
MPRAVEILERFYAVANKIVPIEEVQLALVEQRTGLHTHAHGDHTPVEALPDIEINSPVLKTRRSDLRGRTPHQIAYLRAILEHDIAFRGRPGLHRQDLPGGRLRGGRARNATPSSASS